MLQTNYLYQQPQLCRNQAQLAQELGISIDIRDVPVTLSAFKGGF